MENFNWGEESVKELLSFIHNNKEANMLFWGNACLEDSSKPVRDAIIEWFKKSKEKKPLFTTEDGKEIFKSDPFYVIQGETYTIHKCLASENGLPYNSMSKRFSTEEAAENYVINNKPCLSLNDVKRADYYLPALKNLIKSKLNL